MTVPSGYAILDTVEAFHTPEHIAFHYRLAGPLQRGIAWLIDFLIRAAVLVVLLLFFSGLADEAGMGLWLFIMFLLDWFAGALSEWLWKGFTPGKRIVGIRVVGTDGLPAGLGPCVMRNLLRSADFLPFGFIAGLVTMAGNQRFQRLGDLAAGTVVIYHEQLRTQALAVFDHPRLLERSAELPPSTDGLLDAQARRAIASYCDRRQRFSKERRNQIASHLADPLQERLGLDHSWSPDELLCALYVRCYQEAGSGNAARAAAIIRNRREDWLQLERITDSSMATVGAALNGTRLYRNTCADLALAEAYHLPAKQVRYLHDLVARAHLAVYQRVRTSWRRLVDMLFVEAPGRLFGDPCLAIAAVAFFGVFLFAVLLGWINRDLTISTLGADQIDKLHQMYHTPPRDRELADAVTMGGFYVWNNVGIGLGCFASGIFLGIGSVLYLAFNGLVIGLSFGYMLRVDPATRANFFEFVTAHGPFELSGIMLSGAAGLRLGLGLVDRQGHTWRGALRRAATRSLPILSIAALFIALAAPIEAFVSPSSLPLSVKRAVGITSACFILLYLLLVGRYARQALCLREAERP